MKPARSAVFDDGADVSFVMQGLCPANGKLYRALCTATYCTTLFVGGCVVNVIGQVGPTLAASMHVSVAVIGQIFAAEGVGNMAGSSLIVSHAEIIHQFPCAIVDRTTP